MAALNRKPACLPEATTPASAPIARPRLPTRAEIVPYLDRIDETPRYANHGPLVTELEARLATRLNGEAQVVAISDGALAISLALRAAGARPGTLCVMPAWASQTSASAVIEAGLTPYFVDVDPDTWMLDPAAACAAIAGAPAEVGAVLPVAAFGRVPDLDRWRQLADGTGLPVVVDGAAAFDGLRSAPAPLAVSLDAAAGEGGYVASGDPAFVARLLSLAPAIDAKLSENAAAAALAGLDAWPADRARLSLIAQRLRAGLALHPQIAFQPGWGTRWTSSVCVVGTPAWSAPAIAETLAARGVETRQWWGAGRHRHPAFERCPRTPLPVTERLASSTLGLPYYIGLDEDASQRIVEALIDALEVTHG